MAQPHWIIIHGLRHKESGRGRGPFWKGLPSPSPNPSPIPLKLLCADGSFPSMKQRAAPRPASHQNRIPEYGCGFPDPFNTLIALTISQTYGCGSLIIFKALSEYTVVLFSQYDETIDFLSNLFRWRLHDWGILSVIPLKFQEIKHQPFPMAQPHWIMIHGLRH